MRLNPFALMGLTLLWVLFVGPLWLIGWGARNIAYRVHIVATAWCSLCMRLLP